MTLTQPRLFTPSIPDLAQRYLARLESDAESLTGRLVKVQTKLSEVLDEIATVRAALVRDDGDGMTDAEALADAICVDQSTGEVTAPATVSGAGILTVSGPGVEPFTKAVGERTRFSALIFAWAEQAGIVDVDDGLYEVQLSSDGLPVGHNRVIPPEFYGHEFSIAKVEA